MQSLCIDQTPRRSHTPKIQCASRGVSTLRIDTKTVCVWGFWFYQPYPAKISLTLTRVEYTCTVLEQVLNIPVWYMATLQLHCTQSLKSIAIAAIAIVLAGYPCMHSAGIPAMVWLYNNRSRIIVLALFRKIAIATCTGRERAPCTKVLNQPHTVLRFCVCQF